VEGILQGTASSESVIYGSNGSQKIIGFGGAYWNKLAQ
jgi:hypothetical protein